MIAHPGSSGSGTTRDENRAGGAGARWRRDSERRFGQLVDSTGDRIGLFQRNIPPDEQFCKADMANSTLASDPFATDYLLAGIEKRSARGAAVTLAGQSGRLILSLSSTALLARILLPSDFGLVAMVAALTGLIAVFRDLGLSSATIQQPQIDHGQISTLFWANTAMGIAVTVVVALAAWPISQFYQDPRLVDLTLFLSLSFLLSGVTAQHHALLKRSMRFGTIVIIDLTAQLSGLVLGVVSAYNGAGYWSIAIMQIATDLVTAGAVWHSVRWMPGRAGRISDVKEMLVFGRNLTYYGVVNHFARNFDNVLIGRFCGAQALGLYGRAYSLLLLPIGQIVAPITQVVVPALSRLQVDPERYRDYYLTALRLTAYLATPPVVCLAVLSDDLVLLVLGPNWSGVGALFRLLAIGGWMQPVMSTSGWLFTSSGRTDKMARWGVVGSSLIVVSFLIGIPFGAAGVALSYAICMNLLALPLLWYVLDGVPISRQSVLRTLLGPIIVAGACGLATAGSQHLLHHYALIVRLPCSFVLGVFGGTGIAILLLPSARKEIVGMFAQCRRMLQST